MRFHFGAIPISPDFTPDALWKPLRQPSPWMALFVALPIGIVAAVVAGLWFANARRLTWRLNNGRLDKISRSTVDIFCIWLDKSIFDRENSVILDRISAVEYLLGGVVRYGNVTFL